LRLRVHSGSRRNPLSSGVVSQVSTSTSDEDCRQPPPELFEPVDRAVEEKAISDPVCDLARPNVEQEAG